MIIANHLSLPKYHKKIITQYNNPQYHNKEPTSSWIDLDQLQNKMTKKLIKWSKEMFVLRNLLATINPSLISDFTLAR